MDTTDITNRIQDEQEAEELAEQIRNTEEDNGFDRKHYIDKDMEEDKKYTELHESLCKEAYKHLYEMGLNTEQVRKKLEKLSEFFGEFAFSRLSNEQIGYINMWLKDLETLQFKF